MGLTFSPGKKTSLNSMIAFVVNIDTVKPAKMCN